MRAAVAIEWADRKWSRDEILPAFAPALRAGIEREFLRRHARGPRRDANLWLFDLHQMWRAAPKWIADARDTEDVDDVAHWAAKTCAGIHRDVHLDAFTLRHRLPVVPGDTEVGRLARARDWQWWRRQIRRAVFRYHDQFQRHLGRVHRRAQVYCSDVACAAQAARQRANERLLAQLDAVSDTGQTVPLSDVHGRSVANPTNRRNEVMTRLAGFERFADRHEHRALFATITCPSRFHCRHQDGRANAKWSGADPRAANNYLVKLWSRARAALARARVTFYGFRIVEPHHDGCPHWHALLWIAGGVPALKTVQDILRRYAMADSPTEAGARKVRTKFEVIDRAKGSAVGYVAKYIAKSIDGFGVGEDLFGNPAEAAASRIVAWARTWGIRQFQQIGGPSVTAWREYRRIRVDEQGRCPFSPDTPHLVPWMDASMRADWGAFYACMGSGRAQRTQLHREHRTVTLFGAPCVLLNRYGERPAPSVRGLLREGRLLVTHDAVWRVERRSDPARAARPWTRVNNCTPEPARGPP